MFAYLGLPRRVAVFPFRIPIHPRGSRSASFHHHHPQHPCNEELPRLSRKGRAKDSTDQNHLSDGNITYNKLLAQVVRCWLSFLGAVGLTPTWLILDNCGCSPKMSTGGMAEVFLLRVFPLGFPLGFPSTHGFRVMVNTFLPIRPDVTSWLKRRHWEKSGTGWALL